MRFFQQLPDKYREALQLTEIQGYSQKQMSELLDLSFSGAKSRVQRGRVKLREMLEACCRFELDRYGNILEYESRSCTANAEATQCGCN